MAKIVRFHELGSADVLKIEDVPDEPLAPDEARIKVRAIGLNRAEVLLRQGRYLERPRLPSRIGYEASGEILELGAEAARLGFRVGEKISVMPCFSMTRYGVYGREAVVPARALARYPDSLSEVEAAAVWMQYLTAYGALIEIGKLQKNEWLLVTAASSSVGYSAIQLAKNIGVKVIGTTRSTAKRELLLEAGADHVIVTDEQNLRQEVSSFTGGHGADVIFDAVAGPIMADLAVAAAYQARIFIYGALSLQTTVFPLQTALRKGLSINGYTMFQIVDDEERFKRARDYIYAGLADGTLKPVIDKVFALEEIVEAQKYMETNQQNGKIMVRVD
ncbi:MAG: zinc-dependent alcohol dehydrogenase family protein [Cyanobacteria bacterium REEB67]|nr:zinc-dependent alcohol dehydrogenase family protein [Cyanobacteria bacterium REEB67]